MTDNTNITGKPDSDTINIGQEHELTYWANELGVSKAKIIEAVRAVGKSVAAVKKYLGK